jgi:hypothetical protein
VGETLYQEGFLLSPSLFQWKMGLRPSGLSFITKEGKMNDSRWNLPAELVPTEVEFEFEFEGRRATGRLIPGKTPGEICRVRKDRNGNWVDPRPVPVRVESLDGEVAGWRVAGILVPATPELKAASAAARAAQARRNEEVEARNLAWRASRPTPLNEEEKEMFLTLLPFFVSRKARDRWKKNRNSRRWTFEVDQMRENSPCLQGTFDNGAWWSATKPEKHLV